MNDSLNPYIQELVNVYSEHTDVTYAEWSKRYLKNKFDFLGIRTPIRRKLTKQFIRENGLPQEDKLKDIIFSLWDLPEREYQKAALDILEKVKKDLSTNDMLWLTSLLVKKSVVGHGRWYFLRISSDICFQIMKNSLIYMLKNGLKMRIFGYKGQQYCINYITKKKQMKNVYFDTF